MKYGLNDETMEKIKSIFVNYIQIEKATLYGSRAKGNYKNGSDIDITFFGENIDLSTLNKIANELDDLLLPYSFDLCSYKTISNHDLINHIDRVGIVIYEKTV